MFMANGLEMARLESTEAWGRLNPTLAEILRLAFKIGGDLVAAVETTHPHFTRQRAEAVAASILEDETVKVILLLRSGAVVLSDAPPLGCLENLFRRREWADLQPLQIRLREDDISESGETLDLQRVLRLYFTTANDMRAAIEMYRPDLDQPSVAKVAKEIWESPDVRRILALRRGAE
jgi:hypothetical protein